MAKRLYSLLLLLLMAGCSEPAPSAKASGLPEWVFCPSKGGVVGAVGQAAIHFKGKAAQRELAITRAIDELAMQGPVQVDSTHEAQTKLHGTKVSRKMQSETYISTKGLEIQAHIEAIYHDPRDKTLYVWVIRD